MTIEELDKHIAKYIQGGFGPADMAVMKEECEKLKPGDIYVEIGVDEGRSARVAHEYAPEGVYKIYIDIHDPQGVEGITIGRARWMEQEGMVGIGKKGFYIHGDADEFAKFIESINNDSHDPSYPNEFIDLIFIDGHHDYESVKNNTIYWEPFMKEGSTMLFHDTDYPDGVLKWLNEHYKDNWENCHGKVGRVRK